MKRQLRFAAETAALLVLLTSAAACGEGSAAPPAESPSGAPATNSASAPVAEDLTFSGALAGHMTSGAAGDAFVCAATGGSYLAGPILGTMGGAQLELNIAMLSFHGAGTYPPDGVSIDVGYDHYYPVTGSAGSLAIGSDLTSGTLDIALAVNSDPNHSVAHVTGTWRCPKGGS